MNTLIKTNGNAFPSLLTDFFGASPFFGPSLLNVDLDLLPSRLGATVQQGFQKNQIFKQVEVAPGSRMSVLIRT